MKSLYVLVVTLFAFSAEAKEMFCFDSFSDGGLSRDYNVTCSEKFLMRYFIGQGRISYAEYYNEGYSNKRMKAQAVKDLAKYGIAPVFKVNNMQIYARDYDNSNQRDFCIVDVIHASNWSGSDHYNATRLWGCTEGVTLPVSCNISNEKELETARLAAIPANGFQLEQKIYSTDKQHHIEIYSRKH